MCFRQCSVFFSCFFFKGRIIFQIPTLPSGSNYALGNEFQVSNFVFYKHSSLILLDLMGSLLELWRYLRMDGQTHLDVPGRGQYTYGAT